MPSMVWSACLLLIVTCIVADSDNHRIDLDELLAYYEPLPENFQSSERMLDHLQYADNSRPPISQQDSRDVETNAAFFHAENTFSKPPSDALSGSPLMHLLEKNVGADSLNENTDDESNGRRWEPLQDLSSTDKRAGVVPQHRFKPTREYKRERNGGTGPSLSVDSSLNVVRQRILEKMILNRMIGQQKQIQSNQRLLDVIGKRGGNVASRNHLKQLSSH